MSTRLNKKQRKGRNNANNRERTVTTLTEDPNTPYLVPTPSEEPAGSHMSASFPGSSGGSGKMHNMSMGPQAYQMQSNFGYGYTPPFAPMQNVHQKQQHQPQQQQQSSSFFSPPQQHVQQQQHPQMPDVRPKIPLPPGKNDLEILQNLQKIIKDNQHPFYKAIPSPAALASLYKGTIPTQSQQTAGRPEQEASDYRNDSTDGPAPTTPSNGFGQSGDTRQPRTQGKDRRSGPAGPGGNQQNNNSGRNRYVNPPGSNNVGNLSLVNLKISQASSGPPSAGLQPETRPSDVSVPSTESNANQDVADGQRQGRYDYPAHSRFQRNDFAAMNDRPGDTGYDPMDPDISMNGKDPMYGGKDEMSRSGGWAPRDAVHPPNPNDRGYISERATTPRPQATGGPTNDARPLGGIDRGAGTPGDGHDHDRARGDWHERDRRLSHGHDSRLTDSRRSSSAAEQRPSEAEHGQRPVPRAPSEPSVPIDTRHVSEIPPSAGDIRPPVDSRPQPDIRAAGPHPPPARPIDRLGPDTEDIQSSRSSSARPADVSAPLGSIPPVALGDNLVDDPSMRPSLKDRMSQPFRPMRTSSEAAAIGSGEQQQQQQQHPPPMQDRSRKPNKFQKDRGPGYNGPPYDAPPRTGDRAYHRPPTPPGPPPMSGGGPHPPHRDPPHRAFNPRSASVEGRSKLPPSGSPAARGPRDFRGPGRDMTRPGNYRPDFHEPRYPGPEPDAPPPRYEGRPYREFSPPPPMSAGRGPPGVDTPPGRDYHQYPPGRRDWGPADDEDYYKSRAWDGPLPAGEKGRYERDYPPRSAGYDREFVARDGYPPGPPGPPVDDRYPPGPPIRDNTDRGRPPLGGYNALPYNRVRPRSPSPLRRGSGPIDDSRPMKRPREDFPPEYYPAAGRDGMRRPPGDYPGPPPRSATPGAPPNSGWGPPPTSASSTATIGVGPPGDRDYRMGRDSVDYGPPGGYDRPRSPGPPPGGRMPYNRGGGGYGRGGEPRDRGGYGMQRP